MTTILNRACLTYDGCPTKRLPNVRWLFIGQCCVKKIVYQHGSKSETSRSLLIKLIALPFPSCVPTALLQYMLQSSLNQLPQFSAVGLVVKIRMPGHHVRQTSQSLKTTLSSWRVGKNRKHERWTLMAHYKLHHSDTKPVPYSLDFSVVFLCSFLLFSF